MNSSRDIEVRNCAGIDDTIRRAARLWPGNTAVVSDPERWTFSEFHAGINSIAHRLATLGIPTGAHCATLLDHGVGIGSIAAFFAVQRAGFVVAQTNSKLQPFEIEQQLRHGDIAAVVVSPGQIDKLSWIVDGSGIGPLIVLREPHNIDAHLPAWCSGVEVHEVHIDRSFPYEVHDARPEEAPGSLWYTSGTTGLPKGVLHTRRSTLEAVSSWIGAWGLRSDDSLISFNFFHIGMVSTSLPMLAAGGTIVIVPDAGVHTVLSRAQDEGVTHLNVMPVVLNLLDRDPTAVEQYDLSSVRTVAFGAAAVDPELLRRSVERFPGAVWAQGWAQTEINSGGTRNMGQDFFDHFGSIGLPIACVEEVSIRLDDREVEDGVVGELCIRGPMVMVGYYKNEAATAATIRDGWLHTGDLAYREPSGHLHLRGRSREVIIRGGENVYPLEVENVLDSHPDVVESAVIGIADTVMTEVPLAFVVMAEGVVPDLDLLDRWTRERLARFKCPVKYVVIDALPRNTIGKVRKPALAEMAASFSR